jgi:hypothetical protein
MPECEDPTEVLLRTALQAAVPLHIEELRGLPWTEIRRLAGECAQVIAEKGDRILYRSKKKGETAVAFNALARGIAALAFCPGGVTTLGMHFEAHRQNIST